VLLFLRGSAWLRPRAPAFCESVSCISSSDLAPLVVMNLGSSVPAELRAWGDNRRHGPAS
jgi:hypothetical protein